MAERIEILVHNTTTGEQGVRRFTKPEVWIGRDESNDIRVPTYFVSGKHARITTEGVEYFVEAFGINGTFCNTLDLERGRKYRLRPQDQIRIADHELTVLQGDGRGAERGAADAELMRQVMEVQHRLHSELLRRMDLRSVELKGADTMEAAGIRRRLEATLEAEVDTLSSQLRDFIVRLALKRELIAHLDTGDRGPVDAPDPEGAGHINRRLEEGIREAVRRLAREIGFQLQRETRRADIDRLQTEFDRGFRQAGIDLSGPLAGYIVKRWLRKELGDLIFGFGPLQDLLELNSVSEIMVVRKDQIYVEMHGVIEDSGRSFLSDEMVIAVLERIVSPVGRRIDRSIPLVDARLPDGSRVNAIIPPLAVSGPCITIRKFSRRSLTAENLVAHGSMTLQVANFLKACVVGRRNLVVSGGTGSGKTTLLNVLSSFIPPEQRIVTIEDSAELQLVQKHVVTLEARPAKAMNTGHDGSMTTGHANTPADMILRLETMVLMAVDMPVVAIRKQIAAAIDLIVQMERFAGGQRRVTRVSEVMGMDEESGEIVLEDIFVQMPVGDDKVGVLMHSGYIPTFAEDLIERGMLSLDALFGPGA
jgi:Flp pilus assembly CpaF family ATPase/pSer/pThr/pTyr-binding forkhead associated (FHA) protein